MKNRFAHVAKAASMASWFHKAQDKAFVGGHPSFAYWTPPRKEYQERKWESSSRHLHMYVCAVTHVCQASWSPWWWVLGAQCSVPGSLGLWSSSVGRGKGNGTGPPLHPRCPEITHYRWTGRSPALRPAGSQPLPAEGGSSAGSVQTRVQNSAPCPSCGLTQDGYWCDCPILCRHYLELCWIRYETCIKLKIQIFAHRIRESKCNFWMTCY